jgi:FkbM family methyltransferase
MPTVRQSLIAKLTRRYPFYSGCASIANKSLIHNLAGESTESVWSHVPGGEVLAPLNDYVGRSAFYLGDLDRKLTWICSQIIRPGDTVLDIGANIGIVTLLLSKLVGQTGQVHAFEPNPELQRVLQATFDHNQVSNVCLHPIALGAEQGHLELRVPRVNAGNASLIYHRNLSECDVFKVPVRPLFQIIEEEGLTSIRLIKIDVEGFEANVLQGAQEIFKSVRPDAILFELNERWEGMIPDQPVIKILRDLGYGLFSIPRCLFRMHLKRFDPDHAPQLIGHDFLAVPQGECYEKIAKLVNASV